MVMRDLSCLSDSRRSPAPGAVQMQPRLTPAPSLYTSLTGSRVFESEEIYGCPEAR